MEIWRVQNWQICSKGCGDRLFGRLHMEDLSRSYHNLLKEPFTADIIVLMHVCSSVLATKFIQQVVGDRQRGRTRGRRARRRGARGRRVTNNAKKHTLWRQGMKEYIMLTIFPRIRLGVGTADNDWRCLVCYLHILVCHKNLPYTFTNLLCFL